MTASRFASGFIRRPYQRAQVALPPRTTNAAADAAATVGAAGAEAPPSPSSLTVLGGAVVEGRTIAFGTLTRKPRLWVYTTPTATEEQKEEKEEPCVIGYMTGLIAGEPELWICDEDSREWIDTGAVNAGIKAAAARVWSDCVRTCDG